MTVGTDGTPERPAAWAATLTLCAIWLVTGLIGHEPWKPDEAYTVGIVADFVAHGDWVVPMIADEPFLEKPPLFFVTAGLVAKLLRNQLPLHDAARLTAGLFIALALYFMALTAGELYGSRSRSTVLLAAIGCLGFVIRSHQAICDTALFAGIAMGLYGLALTRRKEAMGGVALGAGTAVAFLAKGLLGPGLLGLSALLLALFSAWRQRSYARSLAIAALLSVPLCAAWVVALYLRSPEYFHTWFVTNNVDRYFADVTLGPHNGPLFYLRTLSWYAFPALPLAAWSVSTSLRNWPRGRKAAGLQLPLVVFAVMLVTLECAHDSRELYAMPMLLPLALLAASGIDALPMRAANSLTWLARGVFWIATLILWTGWIALLTGEPTAIHRVLHDFQPGYVERFRLWPFAIAAVATLTMMTLAFARARTRQSGIFHWAAGLTTCWVLAFTLWLPYIEAGKSYRPLFDSLARVIPEHGCIASIRLGEPQRAMLDYYHDIETIRTEMHPEASCDWLLVQGWRASGAPAPTSDWIAVWQGSRPGDRSEFYRLYSRKTLANNSSVRFPG